MKIRLGEKEIDLAAALPIKMGDMRKLKREHGYGLAQLVEWDEDKLMAVALVLAQKIEPSITMEDLDNLNLEDMPELVTFVHDAQGAKGIDRPTSAPSTS